MASSYQQGQDAHTAGVCRFQNPHPIGSPDFASWRRGWDSMADADRLSRLACRATRQIGDHNFNLEGR